MLIATIPGASDYPNHLARHHVFAVVGQGTALDAYFSVDWRWVGNLGVDLPVLALTPLLGVETATRLVSALIAPLTVLGILLLSRSVHGDRKSVVLGGSVSVRVDLGGRRFIKKKKTKSK